MWLNWTSVACRSTPLASRVVVRWYESVFSLLGVCGFLTLSSGGGFYSEKENFLLNLILARHYYPISYSSVRWLLWPSCGQSCSKGTPKTRIFKVRGVLGRRHRSSFVLPFGGHLLILCFVALNKGGE